MQALTIILMDQSVRSVRQNVLRVQAQLNSIVIHVPLLILWYLLLWTLILFIVKRHVPPDITN